MKTSLIILTRNDVVGLKEIYKDLPLDKVEECFVVDGQSKDGTADFCKEKGLRLIVQEKMGRGEAMRIGAREAKGDYIIFLSSDGNEDPGDIAVMVALLDNGCDMVIASRTMQGSIHKDQVKFIRPTLWALKAFTVIVNVLFWARLTDLWNGYRGFKREKLLALNTDAEGFLIEAQQTIRALKRKYRIGEFPTRELQRIHGASGLPMFKTGFGHIILIAKEFFKRKF